MLCRNHDTITLKLFVTILIVEVQFMSKLSRKERDLLIQYIVEAEIKRLSLTETASFLEKIGVDISTNYISTLKNQI